MRTYLLLKAKAFQVGHVSANRKGGPAVKIAEKPSKWAAVKKGPNGQWQRKDGKPMPGAAHTPTAAPKMPESNALKNLNKVWEKLRSKMSHDEAKNHPEYIAAQKPMTAADWVRHADFQTELVDKLYEKKFGKPRPGAPSKPVTPSKPKASAESFDAALRQFKAAVKKSGFRRPLEAELADMRRVADAALAEIATATPERAQKIAAKFDDVIHYGSTHTSGRNEHAIEMGKELRRAARERVQAQAGVAGGIQGAVKATSAQAKTISKYLAKDKYGPKGQDPHSADSADFALGLWGGAADAAAFDLTWGEEKPPNTKTTPAKASALVDDFEMIMARVLKLRGKVRLKADGHVAAAAAELYRKAGRTPPPDIAGATPGLPQAAATPLQAALAAAKADPAVRKAQSLMNELQHEEDRKKYLLGRRDQAIAEFVDPSEYRGAEQWARNISYISDKPNMGLMKDTDAKAELAKLEKQSRKSAKTTQRIQDLKKYLRGYDETIRNRARAIEALKEYNHMDEMAGIPEKKISGIKDEMNSIFRSANEAQQGHLKAMLNAHYAGEKIPPAAKGK